MARTILLMLVALAFARAASLAAQEREGEIVRSGVAVEAVESPRYGSTYYAAEEPAAAAAASLSDDESPSEPAPIVPPSTAAPSKLPASNARPFKLDSRKKSGQQPSVKSSLAKPVDSLITIGGSLCVVLSLFFGLAWLTRRGLPKGIGKLPGEVIEVLGKAPLVKGQELQLVRVGSKLLLICVSPTGCETLTEIVELSEVDRLASICRSNSPSSMTTAFNQVLAGVGREPAAGFTGTVRAPSTRPGGRARA
jgi:flagellar biogenesis protein FliO